MAKAKRAAPSLPSSAETQDLLRLALLCPLVPLTWLFLGWTFSRSIVGSDALSVIYPALREFIAGGSDWNSLLYRPQILGGSKLLDTGVLFPLSAWWALLGLSAEAVLTASVFSIQVIFAFLAARVATDLAFWIRGSLPTETWGTRMGMCWLLAFAPALAWRLGYGHWNLVLGLFPFFAVFALGMSVVVRRPSLTLWAIAAIAILTSVPTIGQQTLVYSVLLGGPCLLALAWDVRRSHSEKNSSWRRLALASALVVLGAVAMSVPVYAGMVKHAFGDDTTRKVGASVLYSFDIPSFGDWIQSFFWSLPSSATQRQQNLLHDFNVPMGPLVLLLALFAWKRFRFFAIALGVTYALSLALGMGVWPISKIGEMLPLVESFRCPHRTWILYVLLLPLLACSGVLAVFPSEDRRSLSNTAIFAALALTGFLLPLGFAEVLGWIFAACVVASALGYANGLGLRSGPVLIVLGALGVNAFSVRLHPDPKLPWAMSEMERYGRFVLSQNPSLARPLTRSHWDFYLPALGVNSPFLAGFSTISGYWFPPRRLIELYSALAQKPVPVASTGLTVSPQSPYFPIFAGLFNVVTSIEPSKDGRSLSLSKFSYSPGEAWIGAKVESVSDMPSMATKLKAVSLPGGLRETVYALGESPKTAGNCQGKVTSVETSRRGQEITVGVENASGCPLVISTAYASNLEVSGAGKTLKAFPAFGVLVGTVVPDGAQKIVVRAVREAPGWTTLVFWSGLLFWIAALVLFKKLRDTSQPARQ